MKKKVLKKKDKTENNFIENKKFGTDTKLQKEDTENSISINLKNRTKNIEIDPETGLVHNGKKGKKLIKKKKDTTEQNANGDKENEKEENLKDKEEEVKLQEELDTRSDEDLDFVVHKVPTTIDIFESERGYFSMLLYSNSFTNTIFINSYLCPRHIRASMLFTNLTIIWFLAAVLYNNTKDPLVVPDFQQQAKNLALNDIWMAFIVPIISSISGFVFWSIFRVSDKRFHQLDSYKRIKDGTLMKELLKEMYLRYIMAYFVMVAVYAAVMWYIIKFTAKFGWKVSWTWWYTGTFSFLFNYLLYDPIVTWFHYVMHGCSNIMWRKVMWFRSIKIACPEVLDSLHIPPTSEFRDDYILNKDKPKEPEIEDIKIEDFNDDRNSVSDFDNKSEIQMSELNSKVK